MRFGLPFPSFPKADAFSFMCVDSKENGSIVNDLFQCPAKPVMTA
jgi:hypothetical protein